MTSYQPYVMGIDGGGSGIRVVIVTPDLSIHGWSEGPTANPSVVGADAAAQIVQTAMKEALAAAGLSSSQIAAVGIGIAGAAARHSGDWLRAVVAEAAPDAICVPSADYEIALTGARGERCGVLVLAGTGSLAYGVNASGASALVGGWGFLLDDKGSGYWIGLQGLKAVVQAADGRAPETALSHTLLGALELRAPLELIPWLYRTEKVRTRDIAQLAPLVLAQAKQGDEAAIAIVKRAASELMLATQTVIRRLDLTTPEFAFAGGLLSTPNPLSEALCQSLGLKAIPAAHHPPVIGAALLALLSLR
ncbi:N-acetylglucosamine kinase [Aggregatilinea lenta]|uniref:N-acetylglucosamine kinase n=1 Tax=Aggregatilinea lenta TaxID=913108 RepID=UPI000E5B7515|nr:BadF/BadG/BcrA/BcrD ATPase family protein [Aggregatilinea lenta]